VSTDNRTEQTQEGVGRPYEPPRLRVVGSVSELTLGPHHPHPGPPGHVLHHSS
jgi:hypothetical protein